MTRPSTGAKGNAKPKGCAKCQGKGWTLVNTQVSFRIIHTCLALKHAFISLKETTWVYHGWHVQNVVDKVLNFEKKIGVLKITIRGNVLINVTFQM